MQLSEQEIIRREALKKLQELGINAFPAEEVEVSDYSISLKEQYEEGKQVKLAGRMMSRRIMGKASFAQLRDSKGEIQIYITRDDLCPGEDKTFYNEVFKKLLDYGDFVAVEGTLFKTQVGEVTVHVTKLQLLSKALKPLPVVKSDSEGKVYDALSDPETRYRQRYVDLIVNPHVRRIFETRSKVFAAMRDFFNRSGYVEVETPVLQPIPGGANARPFVTHHNALDIPLYLRIANELYLKRLIVGGYEGVYEFSRNFRNEGMDRTHNPEFTIMEIYVAYKDYQWMMDYTEQMIGEVAQRVHGKMKVQMGNHEIDFTPPFRRVTMLGVIEEYTGQDLTGMDEAGVRAVCKKLNVPMDESMGKGKMIDEIFGQYCEPKLIQPTFVMDYPVEMSPLCKKHRDNPELTERFELIVNATEIANAYSELNDPIDQRERFEAQLKLSEKGDDEAMFIDHDFLRALEYGMPPTSGMGIGMDRLVMLMTGQSSIQEVLFFPQMRPEKFVKSASGTDALRAMGVDEAWLEYVQAAGYTDTEKLRTEKPTAIHQKMNGYRKKNKLDIPALQLEDVMRWIAD
ncbi:MAG: lysine--tRNA ligase [Cryomorphaceae bacterium]|nr:MAG: lysine--tRNA ligase [Cryomorphaceae bacterium]